MRFHRVKLKNLNSLYGEQVVDFEEDIRSAPLFLIIGPTGAGKSTILDAICLALFGQTPRLARRTGRSETDVAHIMSIGTAAAYAEVEFSVKDPDGASRSRFLATWSTRRAYDDPEGAVQRPERSLYQIHPDRSMRLLVADHRDKYFQPAFDEALRGLSVDDFKRSILLAQGEFSAFLHASDSEKASILERLTNTDDYRIIGERAARRRRVVEDRHRSLMTRLEEMQLLTEPQATELASEIAEAETTVTGVAKRLEDERAKLEWLKKAEDLRETVADLEQAVGAADKRRDERKDDYERLHRDAELHDVEPAWREVARLAAEISQLDRSRKPLFEEIEALEAELAAQTEALTAAKQRVGDATEALKKTEPELRRAHELRAKREGAQREETATKAELDKRAAAFEKLTEQRAATDKAARELQAALEVAKKTQVGLESARPLVGGMTALRARHTDGVAPLEARAEALEEQLEELAERKASLDEQLAGFDIEIAASNKERGTRQAQVTKAKKRVTELTGASALRDAIDGLTAEHDLAKRKAEALREARYLLDRLATAEKERDTLYDRVTKTSSEVRELEQEASSLKELETTNRALVTQCEESLRLTERLIALSSYRRDLESGEPCPLCGSPIHPYCDSDELGEVDAQAQADRERLEGDREAARQKLREVGDRIQLQATKFTAKKTALQHDESRIVMLKMQLEEDQRAFGDSAQRAGYSPLEIFQLQNEDRIDAELAEAEAVIGRNRQKLDQIEAARHQLDAAEEKLETAERTARDITERTSALQSELAKVDELIEARTADLAQARKERDERARAIIDRVKDLGVDLPPGSDVVTALEAAEDRRETLLSADREVDAAEKKLAKQLADIERLDERLADASNSLEEARENHAARAQALTNLDAKLEECLGGRSPDEVRKELEAAVTSAREAQDAASKTKGDLAERLSARHARRKELVARNAAAKAEMVVAEATLDETLQNLGLQRADVEENLLPTGTRKKLRTELEALDKEVTRARTRLDDAAKRLATHAEIPLAAADDTIEDAAARTAEIRDELNQATLALGGLRERWDKHERTKSRRVEVEEEMREVQHDLDVWTSIYGLIGVREGERFKLFAQSLNLQGLVDRANHRLQQLHPRYRLTVARGDGGEPTLAFGVMDRYQANVERPLTTLSGGETFLVSLALALGLADFRRVDMPIETLLLDEGFGTLDQDSLHMALTTLHQLHQDADRQIGIISHVDALKELINTRVIVEPVGHGRSQLRFEFGADYAQTKLALT